MENVIRKCVCVCVCGMIMTSLDQVQTPSLKSMTSTCKQTKLNMAKETINYTLLEKWIMFLTFPTQGHTLLQISSQPLTLYYPFFHIYGRDGETRNVFMLDVINICFLA